MTVPNLPILKFLRTELARSALASLIIKLCGTGLSFLVAIVLARALGPEGYGVYSFVFALVTMAAIPAQMGLPQIVVRETAKAQALESWGKIKGLWRWASLVVGAISLGIAVITLSLAWIFRNSTTELQLHTLVFGIALIPLVTLGNIRGAALRGLRHIVLGQLPELILRPALFVLMLLVGILIYPSGTLTASSAMFFHTIAAALAFVAGALGLKRVKPAQLTNTLDALYESKQWLKSSVPLALVAGMMVINQNTDILLLGLFLTVGDVGVYKVSVSVSTMVAFGLQAVTMAVSPQFARLYTQGDIINLQRLVTMTSRVTFLIALPVILILILFGEFLLKELFSPAFSAAYWPLIILALGQLVNASMGSVGALLNMSGFERETAKGVAIAACSNVLFNLILIPSFGTFGAALATALSMIIWNFLLWRSAANELHINCFVIKVNKRLHRRN